MDALQSSCREQRDRLERLRDAIDAEIRSYPTPIPRCDAQFNHLYAERSRLTRQLQLAEAALADGSPEALSGCLATTMTDEA